MKLNFTSLLNSTRKMGVVALMASAPVFVDAQVNGYSFSVTNGETMETGSFTTLIGTFVDDGVCASTPIGFTYNYGGTNYTTFTATSNGLFMFGGSATTAYTNVMSSLTGPYLVPYWDDNYTDADGNVQYLITGSPGNQKLVVEYNLSYLGMTGTADKHFQIWIYENTTDIKFVYGTGNNTNANFSVGILTSGVSDFISVTTSSGSGTADIVTTNDANTVWPGTGTGYFFTNCTPTSITPDLSTLPDLVVECSAAMPTAPTATNDCGESFAGTTTTSFPITTQGTTVVTWDFDDGKGNTTSQDQNVIVADVTAPVADSTSLPDTTNNCIIASLTAPTATDNCVGAITGTPDVTFPITTGGLTVVTWSFDDGNGNISTQTQNVTIITPDVTVTQTGVVLTANAVGATYQWLDCDNGYAQISGETGQTYTPTVTGNYAVEVTSGGCTDTSACMLADFTSVDELGADFSIYPNPTNGVLNIVMPQSVPADITLYDGIGQVILNTNSNGNTQVTLDLSNLSNGIYILTIKTEDGIELNQRVNVSK